MKKPTNGGSVTNLYISIAPLRPLLSISLMLWREISHANRQYLLLRVEGPVAVTVMLHEKGEGMRHG